MIQMTAFSSPYLLGFEQIEAILDRIAKSPGDGYPPFNIERFSSTEETERFRITLAVAGFRGQDLEVTLDSVTLTISGGQSDAGGRDYLHRGIAARRFSRCFVLAQGMEVTGAVLENGLLVVDLVRPLPVLSVKTIGIIDRG